MERDRERKLRTNTLQLLAFLRAEVKERNEICVELPTEMD